MNASSDFVIVPAIGAGLFHLGIVVFHLNFGRLMDWERQLPRLNATNQALLPVMNWCLIAVFMGIALWLFAYAGGLAVYSFPILAFIMGFWVVRLLLQPIYYGINSRSMGLMTVALIGGVVLPAVLARWGWT